MRRTPPAPPEEGAEGATGGADAESPANESPERETPVAEPTDAEIALRQSKARNAVARIRGMQESGNLIHIGAGEWKSLLDEIEAPL